MPRMMLGIPTVNQGEKPVKPEIMALDGRQGAGTISPSLMAQVRAPRIRVVVSTLTPGNYHGYELDKDGDWQRDGQAHLGELVRISKDQ